MTRTHWFGEDVRRVNTTLDQLQSLLPVFDRYGLGRNRFQDVIVWKRTDGPLPVGTVSKSYVLVQHAQAVEAVTAEIRKADIDPAGVPTRLLISEYGTRVAIRATLPDSYAFLQPNGQKMALTFECFNSVDRTVPLMAAVGWFRFVCGNGLLIGTTSARIRQRHSPSLNLDEVSAVLTEGMASALRERDTLVKWQATEIADEALIRWVDGPVREAWAPFAAARVYGIASTGEDGKPQQGPHMQPHERALMNTTPVPGMYPRAANAYDIAQVLSWVASRRGNVAERLKWRAQIPALMAGLIGEG